MPYKVYPHDQSDETTPVHYDITLEPAPTPEEQYQATRLAINDEIYEALGGTAPLPTEGALGFLGVNIDGELGDLGALHGDVYAVFLTGADRLPAWPTLEDCQAAADLVFAARAL